MKTPLKRAISALRRLTLTDQDRAATVARAKTLQAIDRKRLKQAPVSTRRVLTHYYDKNGDLCQRWKRAA